MRAENELKIPDEFEIEKIEKEILFKCGCIFKDLLKEFSTSVDRSMGYLDKIILPIIMASKRYKSYNPFSEIEVMKCKIKYCMVMYTLALNNSRMIRSR